MEHKHEFTRLEKVSDGCGKPYSIIQKCRVCGYSEVIGHGETEKHSFKIKTIPSTCVSKGRRDHICSKCGYSHTDTLPLISHSYVFNGFFKICRTCGRKQISPLAICLISALICCSVCFVAGLFAVQKNKEIHNYIPAEKISYDETEITPLEAEMDTIDMSTNKYPSNHLNELTEPYTRQFGTSNEFNNVDDTVNQTEDNTWKKNYQETENSSSVSETKKISGYINTGLDDIDNAASVSSKEELIIATGENLESKQIEISEKIKESSEVIQANAYYNSPSSATTKAVETSATENIILSSSSILSEQHSEETISQDFVTVAPSTTDITVEKNVVTIIVTTAEIYETTTETQAVLDYNGYAGGIYSGEEVIELYNKGYNCEIITNNGTSFLSSKTDLGAVIIKSDSYTCRFDKLHGEDILIFCQF